MTEHTDSSSSTPRVAYLVDDDSSPFTHAEEHSPHNYDYDEKKIRRDLAMFIILDELPFDVVARPGFIKLVKFLEPRFTMPSKRIAMRDCMGIYLMEKSKLKAMLLELGPRVCFTINPWTSIQDLNYMSVTAHYIDETWVLHKKILGFRKITDHTESAISKGLENCMSDWGIEKILTITVDNACNNNTTLDTLRRRQVTTSGGKLGTIFKNHEYLNMRCCAHILNLIVQDGLNDIDDSVGKVRNLVIYIKSSPERLDNFKRCVANRKMESQVFLHLDVSTRWNTTYNMLVSVDKYQPIFEEMLEDHNLVEYLSEDDLGRKGLGIPTRDDWLRIKHFIVFLKLFYDVTLKVSASNTSTANIFFHELARIKRHLHIYASSEDISFREMAKRMQVKYDNYWGDLHKLNKFLFVATILDPRCKLIWFSFWFSRTLSKEDSEKTFAMVKSFMEEIFEEYRVVHMTSFTKQVDMETSEQEEYDIWKDFNSFKAEQNLLDKRSELDKYLMEYLETSTSDFNILQWWKANEIKFPILAKVARDVLAIPITGVPSDLVFNTGGHVLDAFRSSLAPRVLQGLICACNWLSSTSDMDYHDETEDPETTIPDLEIDSNLQPIVGGSLALKGLE